MESQVSMPRQKDVDEEAAEEFDRQFPYKEKKKLPEQIFS